MNKPECKYYNAFGLHSPASKIHPCALRNFSEILAHDHCVSMIYNKLRRKYNVKKPYIHDRRISIPDDCIPSRCQHHNNNGCQRQYPPELFLACSGLGIVFGIHVHVRKILISRAASRNLKNSLAYPPVLGSRSSTGARNHPYR